MTKSSLVGLTKGLARDLGPRGITVNVLQPGPTDTDMNPADSPHADEERRLATTAARATSAGAVAYLAGDGARFVTGASIAVDGGYAA